MTIHKLQLSRLFLRGRLFLGDTTWCISFCTETSIKAFVPCWNTFPMLAMKLTAPRKTTQVFVGPAVSSFTVTIPINKNVALQACYKPRPFPWFPSQHSCTSACIATVEQGEEWREKGGQSLQWGVGRKWAAAGERPLACYQSKHIIYYLCSFLQQEWLFVLNITLSSSLTSFPFQMNLFGHRWTKLFSLIDWLVHQDNPFFFQGTISTF